MGIYNNLVLALLLICFCRASAKLIEGDVHSSDAVGDRFELNTTCEAYVVACDEIIYQTTVSARSNPALGVLFRQPVPVGSTYIEGSLGIYDGVPCCSSFKNLSDVMDSDAGSYMPALQEVLVVIQHLMPNMPVTVEFAVRTAKAVEASSTAVIHWKEKDGSRSMNGEACVTSILEEPTASPGENVITGPFLVSTKLEKTKAVTEAINASTTSYFAEVTATVTSTGECYPMPSLLMNGDFEDPSHRAGRSGGEVPGWKTQTGQRLSLWDSSFSDINAPSGNQYSHLDVEEVGGLYQDLNVSTAGLYYWRLFHRGSTSSDVMKVVVADADSAVLSEISIEDGSDWKERSAEVYVFKPGALRITLQPVSVASGGPPTVGNYIDNIRFGLLNCSGITGALTRPTSDKTSTTAIVGEGTSTPTKGKHETSVVLPSVLPPISSLTSGDEDCTALPSSLVNGDFEVPIVVEGKASKSAEVPGWSTTGKDGMIDLSRTGPKSASRAYSGQQFLKLDVVRHSELHQAFEVKQAGRYYWQLAFLNSSATSVRLRVAKHGAAVPVVDGLIEGGAGWELRNGTFDLLEDGPYSISLEPIGQSSPNSRLLVDAISIGRVHCVPSRHPPTQRPRPTTTTQGENFRGIPTSCVAHSNLLRNGNFESLGSDGFVSPWMAPTRKDTQAVWKSGKAAGVEPAEGQQFLELNSFQGAPLVNVVKNVIPASYYWQLIHRSAAGEETIEVIFMADGKVLRSLQLRDGPQWTKRGGVLHILRSADVKFLLRAVGTNETLAKPGNFIDDVRFGLAICEENPDRMEEGESGGFERLNADYAFQQITAKNQRMEDCKSSVALVNGGFEDPPNQKNLSIVRGIKGWRTTARDRSFRIWESGYWLIEARSGKQFVMMSGDSTGMIYQDVKVPTPGLYYFEAAHRGWYGVDTVGMQIEYPGGVTRVMMPLTDGKDWRVHNGTYYIHKAPVNVRVSVFFLDGDAERAPWGNFVDDVHFGSPACTEIAVGMAPSGAVHVGDVVTMRVTLSNYGGFPATFVTFRLKLGKGVEYVENSIEIFLNGNEKHDATDIQGDDDANVTPDGTVEISLSAIKPKVDVVPPVLSIRFKATEVGNSTHVATLSYYDVNSGASKDFTVDDITTQVVE